MLAPPAAAASPPRAWTILAARGNHDDPTCRLWTCLQKDQAPPARETALCPEAAAKRYYRGRTSYAPDRGGHVLITDECESERGVFAALRFSRRFWTRVLLAGSRWRLADVLS